jgi:hypothetical protein
MYKPPLPARHVISDICPFQVDLVGDDMIVGLIWAFLSLEESR